jgi:hypothetical protein
MTRGTAEEINNNTFLLVILCMRIGSFQPSQSADIETWLSISDRQLVFVLFVPVDIGRDVKQHAGVANRLFHEATDFLTSVVKVWRTRIVIVCEIFENNSSWHCFSLPKELTHTIWQREQWAVEMGMPRS